jgi:hypothetical protein
MSNDGAAPRAAVQISNARAEASRRNGAKSRGPKTADGKARSAQNALKHGLRAEKHLVLPDEDGAEFAGLEAAMVAELAPVGALQHLLARRVAVAAWRLARADRIEIERFEERRSADGGLGLALIRDGNGARSFETLLRYRGAAMAEFWRALKTLKALQAEQALEADAAVTAPSLRPAAQPPLANRARPNEPERRSAPEPRLEYLLPDPPTPGALHEPAALWLPNEPESVPQDAPVSPGQRVGGSPDDWPALASGRARRRGGAREARDQAGARPGQHHESGQDRPARRRIMSTSHSMTWSENG